MKRPRSESCAAWPLLVELLFEQRAQLPPLAAELRLSPAQCHVLRVIEPGRAVPMNQVARALACDASNVTGLVDRLESRGLVRRRPSDEDRRLKVLDLTPAGTRVRAVLIERISAPPAAFDRLSPRDQRALVRLLTRLLG